MKIPMIARFSAYGFLKNLRFFEPFLYLYFLSKGFSFFQIGVLVSIREISVYIFEVPTGIIADMFGKKRSMILCFCFYLVSFSVYGLSYSFQWIAGAMVLFAAGEAFRTGTHKAIIMDYLDREGISDRKAHVYGYTRSWSKIGSAVNDVCAALIVFFMVKKDYNIVFLASIVPYVAGLILMFTYPADEKRGGHGSLFRQIGDHCRESWRSFKANTGLLLNSTVYDSVFSVNKDYIQPIIKNGVSTLPLLGIASIVKRSALIIGAVYLFRDVFAAYFSRLAGPFRDRYGKKAKGENMVFAGAGAMYLAVASAVHAKALWAAVAAFLVIMALINIRRPLLVARIAEGVSTEQRATILSVESMLKIILSAVLAPIFGLAADMWGMEAVFAAGGGLLLLMYVPLLSLIHI